MVKPFGDTESLFGSISTMDLRKRPYTIERQARELHRAWQTVVYLHDRHETGPSSHVHCA